MLTNDTPVHGFLKIGRREHMEALLRKGTLHFNTLKYFRGVEEHPGRGDPDEGLVRVYGPEVSRFTASIGKTTFKFAPGTGPLKVWSPGDRDVHIFSLFTITKPGTLTVIGEWLTFGDAFVAIRDPGEFMRRVEKSAESVASRLRYGFVEYVSRDRHAGEMGPFKKYEDFAYQEEFRLALDAKQVTNKPISLEIGSIEDIAILESTAGFKPVTRVQSSG